MLYPQFELKSESRSEVVTVSALCALRTIPTSILWYGGHEPSRAERSRKNGERNDDTTAEKETESEKGTEQKTTHHSNLI